MKPQRIRLKMVDLTTPRRQPSYHTEGYVFGQLAVHKHIVFGGPNGKPFDPVKDALPWERSHGWAVSHLGTGRAIRKGVETKDQAVKIAKALQHLDWDFTSKNSPKVKQMAPQVRLILAELEGKPVNTTYLHGRKP